MTWVMLPVFSWVGGRGDGASRWPPSRQHYPGAWTCVVPARCRWQAPSAPFGIRRRQWQEEAFPPTAPYGKASVTVPPRGEEFKCEKAGSSELRPNTHPSIVSPSRRAAGSSLSAPGAHSTPVLLLTPANLRLLTSCC